MQTTLNLYKSFAEANADRLDKTYAPVSETEVQLSDHQDMTYPFMLVHFADEKITPSRTPRRVACIGNGLFCRVGKSKGGK